MQPWAGSDGGGGYFVDERVDDRPCNTRGDVVDENCPELHKRLQRLEQFQGLTDETS